MARVDLERHSNKGKFNKLFQVSRSRFATKSRWIDGTPENTGIAIGLARMFPDAKFIMLLRRPENVIRSLLRFDQAGGEKMSFEEAIIHWETFSINGYEAVLRLGPERAKLSIYEDLIEDTAAMIDDWFAFLGEPRFPKASLTFSNRINSSGSDTSEFGDEAQGELMRLNQIYEGIIESVPIKDLPLGTVFDSFESRENDVLGRMMSCLTTTPSDQANQEKR